MAKAVAVEEKKLKEEMRVKRGLDHMFPKAADAPTQVRVGCLLIYYPIYTLR